MLSTQDSFRHLRGRARKAFVAPAEAYSVFSLNKQFVAAAKFHIDIIDRSVGFKSDQNGYGRLVLTQPRERQGASGETEAHDVGCHRSAKVGAEFI
jgi:hypothetical protein